jgi:ribosomal protein L16 Arg81 hydroxylase
MISTIQDLIAPLTEAEFLTHIRERTAAFVRTSEPHRFESLLDWDDLNHLVQNGVYPIEELRVHESIPVPTSFYIKRGRFDSSAFSALMDRGADLVLNRLDKYVSRLCRLCHQLAEQTGEQVTAEAIVTSEKKDARQRVNTKDVCVLQIAGSKRWELCGPPIGSPLADISVPPAPQSAPFFDEVLSTGDFLFVPAGCWRRCETGTGRSLDLYLVLEPPCGRDVVTWLTNQLIADETFTAPLTRYTDPSTLASHEAALKARLIEQVQAWSLDDFLAERATARSNEVVVRIQGTPDAAKGLRREPNQDNTTPPG